MTIKNVFYWVSSQCKLNNAFILPVYEKKVYISNAGTQKLLHTIVTEEDPVDG
jgi:hypothetical protein